MFGRGDAKGVFASQEGTVALRVPMIAKNSAAADREAGSDGFDVWWRLRRPSLE
jgi:hypothetical protein